MNISIIPILAKIICFPRSLAAESNEHIRGRPIYCTAKHSYEITDIQRQQNYLQSRKFV